MAPPFASRFSAGAFAALLALLLTLPAIIGATGWWDRRDVYPAIAWKYGPFPWIQQKIFDDKRDVDIAFAGSSHIWDDVDAVWVHDKLQAQLGRDPQVFSLGWPWGGSDALYVIAKDLLDHRHVRMLVVDDEGGREEVPHYQSSRWFRIGENSEALTGLSFESKVKMYGSAVLGMPRQLLSLVRPNILDDPYKARNTFWDTYYHAPNIADRRGTLTARLAYGATRDFSPYTPLSNASPDDVIEYSPQNRDRFSFGGDPTSAFHMHFLGKLAKLCAERGTKLVLLQIPYYPDRAVTSIRLREHWDQVLGAPVSMLGIAPAALFRGIPDNDVAKLFYEDWHLNENGQNYFTPVITPALLKLYAESVRGHQ